MIRFLLVPVLLFLATTCSASQQSNQALYHTLDSLIANYNQLTAEKERRVTNIKDGVRGIKLSPEQQYDLNQRLYDEYVAYKFDSAFYYIEKNVNALSSSADHDRFAASAVRMAHILAVTGLFDRARRLLDKVNPDSISDQQKIAYYTQQSELNLYRSEMAQSTIYFYDYIKRAQYYRQLVMQIAPKDSYDYVFNRATYICEAGDTEEAIRILEAYLNKTEQGTRIYSIITSTLAFFYQNKGVSEKQEYYLLLSAISDERSAIRENNSLRSLSELLMDRGNYDDAYRYLLQAISEAKFYGSRIRMMQVGRMAPQILQLYDAERTRTQQRTSLLLMVISIISIILAGIIVYTLILYRKKHAAGLKIIEMNKMLASHSEEIESVNTQMKEANRIKEEYIGRFLELSSQLISDSEQRLKQLNRLARERKLEELYAELKTMEPVNKGIRKFHSHFDTAFLNIYPNFISEVNNLLNPECRFDVEQDGTPVKHLSTELRVLALIRLDITDNQEIADILRSSITTIYTYRSKIKARAINKESFEDDVRKIATYR
jgi:tetratricopeptide (TPR) repeat protein